MAGFQEFRRRLKEQLLRHAPWPAEQGGPLPPEIDGALIFTRPPKPEMGDLALAAFPLAKVLRLPPPEVAKRWAEAVREELARPEGDFSQLEVPLIAVDTAGPYLNLTLEPAAFARLLLDHLPEAGARYGGAPATGQSVMIEYSSPNTNKPLHLGHVRNNLIGMSISNILETSGNRVFRVNLINDRGIHICKSMLAYQRWGRIGALGMNPGGPAGGTLKTAYETPESTGEKGDHFVGRYYVLFDTRLREEREAFARTRGVDLGRFGRAALRETEAEERKKLEKEAEAFEESFLAASQLMKDAQDLLRRWEAGDPEVLGLWQTMNEWVYAGLRQTYDRLGCIFDHWYYESQTWQLGKRVVEEGLERGVFYRQSDGSVWARLEPLGLKDKVVLRSDGTSVYITQDLGTAIHKFEDFGMDRSIYVVASEQDAHFQNLFAMLRLLGYPWAENCHHASYGMVTLPKGMGKLKSREGTAVDADDLLDELKRLALEKIVEGGYCEGEASTEVTAEQIGQGALKMYILQVSAEKNIQFDPSETIAFTGDTGPAVQYSHARISGILRKGLAAGKVSEADLDRRGAAEGSGPFLKAGSLDAALLGEPEEREVLRLVAEYPDTVAQAARQLSAAPVATALLELTKAYARMYHQHEVLKAEPALLRARLQLALCVAQVLRNGLRLLTIEAPERM